MTTPAPKPPGGLPTHQHRWEQVVAVRESRGVQVTVYGCAAKDCFEVNR